MRSASTMIDITPPLGLGICGNIRADNKCRGIHDPLYCNAVLCEHEDTTLLFLVMDWAGIETAEVKKLCSRTAKALGIPEGNVIVSATHTHSGPTTIDFANDEQECKKVEAYLADVEEKIEKEIIKLPQLLEEVSLWSASIEVEGYSFCRRLRMADGKVIMNWNKVDPSEVVCTTGEPDKQMTIVGFKRKDGTWQSLIVNFALHPAICVGRDWLWSADWVHYLREALWKTFEEKPVVYFVNGTQGDVNHLDYKNFNLDAFPEAERYGYALAGFVKEALGDAKKMKDALAVVNGAVALYKRTIPEAWITWAKQKWEACGGQIPELLHGIPSEFYAKEIMGMEPQQGDKYIFRMAAVKLGEVAFVTVPGEVFSSIGKQIKAASPYELTGVMGLTLGNSGYIPDRKAFLEGGYETRIGAGSQFEEDSCERLLSVASNLLEILEP